MKSLMMILISILLVLSITACKTGGSVQNANGTGNDRDNLEFPISAESELINEQHNELNSAEENKAEDETSVSSFTGEEQNEINTGFTLVYSGFKIYMDQNINDVLVALGEPLGVFEAPSCAFDGIDRIFSYPGIQIHTYPVGDEDFVHTISIRDDSVLIKSDNYASSTLFFHLGSSWDAVKSIFGTDYHRDFDMFTFTRGNTTLAFLVEDDMVTAITYGLTIINT